jgi:hypothetical protein
MTKLRHRLERLEAALKSQNEHPPTFHTLMVATGEEIPLAADKYAEMIQTGEIGSDDRCAILADEGHIATIGPVGGTGRLKSKFHVISGRGGKPLSAEEWQENVIKGKYDRKGDG